MDDLEKVDANCRVIAKLKAGSKPREEAMEKLIKYGFHYIDGDGARKAIVEDLIIWHENKARMKSVARVRKLDPASP